MAYIPLCREGGKLIEKINLHIFTVCIVEEGTNGVPCVKGVNWRALVVPKEPSNLGHIDWPHQQFFWNIGYATNKKEAPLWTPDCKIETNVLP
jgi:hypothetical protein